MRAPTQLGICAVACLILLATSCGREVQPPRGVVWSADRGECKSPNSWCGEFAELDAVGTEYRMHFLISGKCEHYGRSDREETPETVHALVTFQRYPLTDWGFVGCRRVEEREGRAVLAGLRENRPSSVSGWGVVIVFGLPAVVTLLALTGWSRDRRRWREPAGEDVADAPRPAAGDGPAKVLVYRLFLGVYAGFVAAWLHAAPVGGLGRIVLYLTLAFLVGACFVRNWARLTVAVAAGVHIALALVFHGLLLEEVMDSVGALGIPWLLIFHLVVPVTVCLIPSAGGREPVPLNLPAGYDYSLTRKRGLSPFMRIVTAILMIVIGSIVFLAGPAGLLLFAVFVMPVIIGAYLVFHFLTGRREKPLAAKRRFRVSPKLEKPAQTGHHWTVNKSEYQDPDLYNQDDSRPRISREPKEDSD